MNRREWAIGFLGYAGFPLQAEKVTALVAQASKEDTGALCNPLATTEPSPGATEYNSAGVKNYTLGAASGWGATLATFRNGDYPTLLSFLEATGSVSALTYAASPELDTWGTGNCVAFVNEIRGGDPQGYLGREVPGTGPPGPTPEEVPMLSPTVFAFGQLHLLQVSSSVLWHKWHDHEWHNEAIPLPAIPTGSPQLSPDPPGLLGTVEDTTGRVWAVTQAQGGSWVATAVP